MGIPKMVDKGKSHLEMDDLGVPPWSWKPLYDTMRTSPAQTPGDRLRRWSLASSRRCCVLHGLWDSSIFPAVPSCTAFAKQVLMVEDGGGWWRVSVFGEGNEATIPIPQDLLGKFGYFVVPLPPNLRIPGPTARFPLLRVSWLGDKISGKIYR